MRLVLAGLVALALTACDAPQPGLCEVTFYRDGHAVAHRVVAANDVWLTGGEVNHVWLRQDDGSWKCQEPTLAVRKLSIAEVERLVLVQQP